MTATKVQRSDSFAQIITWKYHFYSRCSSVCSERRQAFIWNNLACRLVYCNWTIRISEMLDQRFKVLLGQFCSYQTQTELQSHFQESKAHIQYNIIQGTLLSLILTTAPTRPNICLQFMSRRNFKTTIIEHENLLLAQHLFGSERS
jgi:hypothetical protein